MALIREGGTSSQADSGGERFQAPGSAGFQRRTRHSASYLLGALLLGVLPWTLFLPACGRPAVAAAPPVVEKRFAGVPDGMDRRRL